MYVLAIVPARGGSKGVPRKNIRNLAGKPLICWTIEAALDSKSIDRVLVSSDDEEICAIANRYGPLAPFRRPSELATDEALTFPVVEHAVKYVEGQNQTVDTVILLQPTTPLRNAEDIEKGFKKMTDSGCDCVVSVVDVGGWHPFRMKRIVDGDRLINWVDQGFEDMRPRHELPEVYIREGSLYIVRREVLRDNKSMVGGDVRAVVLGRAATVNIDTETDFLVAERLMMQRLNEGSKL